MVRSMGLSGLAFLFLMFGKSPSFPVPQPGNQCAVTIYMYDSGAMFSAHAGVRLRVTDDTLADDLRGGCSTEGPVSSVKIISTPRVPFQRVRAVQLLVIGNAPASAPVTFSRQAVRR
jgi:hypothetical protein